MTYWYLHLEISDSRGLSDLAAKSRASSKGWEPKPDKFRLEIKCKLIQIFTTRLINCLNNLPRNVVNSPSLGVSKSRLDWSF